MVSIDKAVVAKLKKNGKHFEILVDCEKALESRKGETVSEKDMIEVFKTKDSSEVAKLILKEGEIPITKEIKDTEREVKRKKIIEIIHRNGIDSKTGLPHPPQRIENAINEARVHIDENKSAEEQIEAVLEKIRVIIPIRFETKKIEIRIPAKYAGASLRILKMYGKVMKTDWKSDGSLESTVEIPAGIIDEFFSKLNGLCHGEVFSKIL